jgi:addiction module HigA family antidote
MKRDMPPVHPGEILIEDFLKPLGITQYRLAKSIGVPQRRIGEIVSGKRAITADTALRLAKFFGTDAQSWLNLQTHYDLEVARDSLQAKLEQEVTPMAQVGQREIESMTESLP